MGRERENGWRARRGGPSIGHKFSGMGCLRLRGGGGVAVLMPINGHTLCCCRARFHTFFVFGGAASRRGAVSHWEGFLGRIHNADGDEHGLRASNLPDPHSQPYWFSGRIWDALGLGKKNATGWDEEERLKIQEWKRQAAERGITHISVWKYYKGPPQRPVRGPAPTHRRWEKLSSSPPGSDGCALIGDHITGMLIRLIDGLGPADAGSERARKGTVQGAASRRGQRRCGARPPRSGEGWRG